ncbi:MAG: NAD-dependent epimerase/dehydratase family protein [Deltaproteobacteria bacterium]|nr:NAD-dependent epimerase/dehydratase family protein [Deltaproteobacteria bacterium]
MKAGGSPHLVREGWRVTALHRPTSDLTYLKRFPIDLAEGSITDRESLERAIPAGTEVVFHVAGDTSFWSKGDAQQDAINIDGTRHMVEVAASKGVRTFIHTSSDSAWGRVKGTVTEETPLQGKDSWINYERSKHLGELEALTQRTLWAHMMPIPGDGFSSCCAIRRFRPCRQESCRSRTCTTWFART